MLGKCRYPLFDFGSDSMQDAQRWSQSRVAVFLFTYWMIVLRTTFPVLVMALLPAIVVAQGKSPSNAPGLKNLPTGWEVVRESEISGQQLVQFSSKLGVTLKSLFNTVFKFEGKDLQINTISVQSKEDAQRLKEILRKGKSNVRWIVQNDTNVYEFVVRTAADARLASSARYDFPIQPSRRDYELQFDAIPISDEQKGVAVDSRNKLFNLLIQNETKTDMSEEIKELSKSFVFGSDFQVVKDLQGQVVATWRSPNADVVAQDKSELCRITPKGSFTKIGVSAAQLRASISIDSKRPRKVESNFDRSSLIGANTRFPTQSPELQAVVRKLIAKQDTDSVKLRKLLDWFADSKNIRYDGLVGSRCGTMATYNQHFGRCWDYADLFVTMARIAGLPARQVYGWLYESEGHVWCDVVVDGRWMMVDPTSGSLAGSDYIPICVSADGEFSLLYASKVEIREK
ncbi:MAG: transglutaminase-like domain-containing protein [Pirellulales bacterium]